MLNVDYSTTVTSEVVDCFLGAVAAISAVTLYMSVCEALLYGHSGVFWLRVFHNANTRYVAELLPSLLDEEALEVGLDT